MTMKVMDNSVDDPVQGYVCDVTYSLDIPMVVKQEKADEEDDLKIVGVTLATKNIIDVLTVKTEKTTPLLSPHKGATRETGTSPQKNMTEDNPTASNKDVTEDSVMLPQKDETEDMSPKKSSTPQKVKLKPQKTLGNTNTRTLRSQVHKKN